MKISEWPCVITDVKTKLEWTKHSSCSDNKSAAQNVTCSTCCFHFNGLAFHELTWLFRTGFIGFDLELLSCQFGIYHVWCWGGSGPCLAGDFAPLSINSARVILRSCCCSFPSLLPFLYLMHPSVLSVLWHHMRHSLDGALDGKSKLDTSSLMCSLCFRGMNDFVGDSLKFCLRF